MLYHPVKTEADCLTKWGIPLTVTYLAEKKEWLVTGEIYHKQTGLPYRIESTGKSKESAIKGFKDGCLYYKYGLKVDCDIAFLSKFHGLDLKLQFIFIQWKDRARKIGQSIKNGAKDAFHAQ
jgi:hypothetical protein